MNVVSPCAHSIRSCVTNVRGRAFRTLGSDYGRNFIGELVSGPYLLGRGLRIRIATVALSNNCLTLLEFIKPICGHTFENYSWPMPKTVPSPLYWWNTRGEFGVAVHLQVFAMVPAVWPENSIDCPAYGGLMAPQFFEVGHWASSFGNDAYGVACAMASSASRRQCTSVAETYLYTSSG